MVEHAIYGQKPNWSHTYFTWHPLIVVVSKVAQLRMINYESGKHARLNTIQNSTDQKVLIPYQAKKRCIAINA